MADLIKSGIELRDIAIKAGVLGVTTLLFKDGNEFLIPGTNFDALGNETQIQKKLIESLQPENNDVIIIGSNNKSKKIAEIATKYAALFTMIIMLNINYIFIASSLNNNNNIESIGVIPTSPTKLPVKSNL